MTFLLALLWSVAMPGFGVPARTPASTIELRPGGLGDSQAVLAFEEPSAIRRDGHEPRREDAVELGSLIIEDSDEEQEETSESPDDSEPGLRPPASDREALARHHLAASRIPDPSLRDVRSIRLRL